MLVVSTLTLAASASAAFLHPTLTEKFGPDGTAASAFIGGMATSIGFDQAHKRLYVLRPRLYEVCCIEPEVPPQPARGIHGFEMSAPGAHSPLGGGFPIPVDTPTYKTHLAVDESEGNVYYGDIQDGVVNETLLGTVYGWDSSGNPLGGSYPLVLSHRAESFVVDPLGYLWIGGHKYSPEGTPLGAVPSGQEVAFNRLTGDAWTFDFSGETRRYTAASGYTEYDRRFRVQNAFGTRGMAVDAAHGVLYFLPNFGAQAVAYNESGSLVETLTTPGKLGGSFYDIAVNEETGEVYLLDNALYGANEQVKEGKIDVFAGAIVPDVETGQPTNIGHTNATLNGHLDPAGGPDVTGCEFQYAPASAFNEIKTVTISGASGGSFLLWFSDYTNPIPYNATAAEVQAALEALASIDSGDVGVSGGAGGPYAIEFKAGQLFVYGSGEVAESHGAGLTPSGANATSEVTHEAGDGWSSPSTVPCSPPVSPGSPIGGPTDVSAAVSGLGAGTEYRFRLVATNANGTNFGEDETLIPQPSLTKTGVATNVQPTTATLNGTVDPEGLETTFYFQYGKTKNYGQTSAAPPGVGVGSAEAGDKPVSAPIAGLQPGATYHYRLLAVNANGTSHGVDRTFTAAPAVKNLSTDPATAVDRVTATLNGTLDPDGLGTHYYFEWGKTKRYGQNTATPPGAELGTVEAGPKPVSAPISGLKVETTYHYRLVASNATYGTTYGNDRTFTTTPAIKAIATDPASEVKTDSATLNGALDPDGYATTFYFEWGKTKFYGHTTATPPGEDVGTSDPGTLPLSSALAGLEPGTTYHYRIVAVNGFGTSGGVDRSFSTPQGPAIEGVFSANLSANSADLKAKINPHGFETTYRFEYGTTSNYGSSAPVPDGALGPASIGQDVTVSLNGLQTVTYHFRLVAESQWGTATSEDQTFNFNPPSCPNAAVRQLTGAAYLPDCRAYELVSPARTGGAVLRPRGPTSPYATNRLAYTAGGTAIPGAGDPPNGGTPLGGSAELYVASRTTGGWVTRYVGLPGNVALGQWGDLGGPYAGTSGIPTDQAMNRFLTWNSTPSALSYAPYAWDNEGNALGRLPTNLEEVPGAKDPAESGGFIGTAHPSPDFSHYVFSATRTAFAEGGLTGAPGSVYDNELSSGAIAIASKTAAGAAIPQDPLAGTGNEYLRIPAVSVDGSHILISTAAPDGATHLYMRVNGAVSYDVSLGEDAIDHGVKFEGMSEDGSAVYFTTAAQMTADDHDSSVDLYRWSEDTDSLSRLSVGAEGDAGDTDTCNPDWTSKCNVAVVSIARGAEQPVDNALAAESGDIYFYSPEQLEGARGIPDKRNLYLWRGGEVHYVATLSDPLGAERINVSSDGSHMAFVTKGQITAYDNAGHAEMYTYDPVSRGILCVSCHPDGSAPTSEVEASQNGLFMTDDGRAFFSTTDALVARDANGIRDVYEYVDGRPQLISSGTGNDDGVGGGRPVGLLGVSADGTNAFISTYETLVAQDENGPFFKFYVARVNGGFPFNKPAAPCAAADECHGPGNSSPALPQIGSGANLGAGGNAKAAAKKAKKHRKRKGQRHRAGKRHRHSQRAGR